MSKPIVVALNVACLALAVNGCSDSAPSDTPAHKETRSTPAMPVTRTTKDVELDGQAVLLTEVLKNDLSLELVDPALDAVVTFQTKDGRLIPILPTTSGLFFYRDERVRNRPMRIKARTFEGLDALEIVDRFALVDGKPHEIYYWCEICSIQMHHLQQCECCQGPIELREHPVGEAFVPRSK